MAFKVLISQQHQFMARIKLLDAGLIAESHQVINFMPTAARDEDVEDEEVEGSGKTKKTKATAVDAETAADAIVRLGLFVKDQLHRASKRGKTKDSYKDGLVYTERRALLDEVLRVQQRSWRIKCTRCAA